MAGEVPERPRVGEPSERELARPATETSKEEVTAERARGVIIPLPLAENLPVFTGPKVEGVFEAALPQVFERPRLPGVIPFIGHARFQTPEDGWYKISYPDQTEPPTVVSVSEHREGWYEPEDLYTPKRLDEDNIARKARRGTEDAVRRYLGNWGWLNFIRDTIAWACGVVGYVMGYLTAWVANMILDDMAAHATSAVYKSIDRLHQFSGRPQMRMTTPEVRGVTTSGAEILGYAGGANDVVVIGKRSFRERGAIEWRK